MASVPLQAFPLPSLSRALTKTLFFNNTFFSIPLLLWVATSTEITLNTFFFQYARCPELWTIMKTIVCSLHLLPRATHSNENQRVLWILLLYKAMSTIALFSKSWKPLFFQFVCLPEFDKYENHAFFNTSASQHVNRRRHTFFMSALHGQVWQVFWWPFQNT